MKKIKLTDLKAGVTGFKAVYEECLKNLFIFQGNIGNILFFECYIEGRKVSGYDIRSLEAWNH